MKMEMELKDTRSFATVPTSHAWLRAILLAPAALLIILLAAPPQASAVPSFARQTGLACSACHINPPELTPLGRQFKLNGYTMTGITTVSAPSQKSAPGLALLSNLPVSVMFQISETGVNRPQPDTQNWNFALPQEVSLFLAGSFATHAGGFVEAAYAPEDDHFSWDNTDIRYANNTLVGGKSLVYGITFNNNPGLEDLWNDTPAWGYPWFGPEAVPETAAASIIDGGLSQDVAGLGAYTMFANHLYGAVTVYRSLHIGCDPPPNFADCGADFNIQNAAPYWRAAWQQSAGNNYLEFGTYGMYVKSTPETVSSLTDNYTDYAVDAQYERVFPTLANDILTIHTTYIRENSDLYASFDAGGVDMVPHHLNTFKIDGFWHFGYRYEPGFAYFVTTGTHDQTLYEPDPEDPIGGSLTGDPKNQGFITEFTYWPVQNIRLAFLYKHYITFNGGTRNYNGLGRNASDNDFVSFHLALLF